MTKVMDIKPFQAILHRLDRGLTRWTGQGAYTGLGVSRSAINAWENGISFPSLANLFELCHVFGTTPDYLLGFSAEHCVDISALTPSQREMVVRLIHCFEEQNDMPKGRSAAPV